MKKVERVCVCDRERESKLRREWIELVLFGRRVARASKGEEQPKVKRSSKMNTQLQSERNARRLWQHKIKTESKETRLVEVWIVNADVLRNNFRGAFEEGAIDEKASQSWQYQIDCSHLSHAKLQRPS